jgi:D-threo-aldose 1-dehydrogenase
MEYVRLAANLPPSSRLGFGCGSVMGRVGRSESRRAIAAALDAGITHFDVARLYGYGEAEALLGEALRGRRDRVVIASKFGLAPPAAASALRALKPLAQRAVAGIPGLRPLLRAVVGADARPPGRFSPAAAAASLEQSLAALGTDYLDILFLHDGQAADLTAELKDFLDAQVAAGKIHAYGVATAIDTVAQLIQHFGDNILYQFGNSVCVRNAERLPRARRRYIAHSPFLGADRLAAQRTRLQLPDLRLSQPPDLHALMLAYALGVDNIAVVLCSMLKPAHLAANLAVVEQPSFTAEALFAFAASVAETEATATPGR